MKKTLMLVGLGTMSFLWGSQDMTIQVINAVYEKSITKEFEAKLKESGLTVKKTIEDGHHIVTLGTYKDEKSAQKDLDKVRNVVVKDAFVRLVDRSAKPVAKNVKAKTKTVAAKAVKQTKTADKSKVETKAHAESKPAAPEHKEAVAAVTPAAVHEVKPAVHEAEKKPEVKATAEKDQYQVLKHSTASVEGPSCPITPAASEVKTIPILASVVMVERNELRRQEIHEAIEYYKNSPYHRFEPVKLQP